MPTTYPTRRASDIASAAIAKTAQWTASTSPSNGGVTRPIEAPQYQAYNNASQAHASATGSHGGFQAGSGYHGTSTAPKK